MRLDHPHIFVNKTFVLKIDETKDIAVRKSYLLDEGQTYTSYRMNLFMGDMEKSINKSI